MIGNLNQPDKWINTFSNLDAHNVIASVLYQDISIFGFKVNVGQVLTTALVLGGITIYFVKKASFGPMQKPLSDEVFWDTVKNFPSVADETAQIVIGNTTFSNLSEARKEMAVSCTKTSDYVKKYLVQSNFKGSVLDLGCGVGANAIPLVAKGCQVTIIDIEKDAILAFNGNEMGLFISNIFNMSNLHQARSIIGDITIEEYPKNLDAVICIDTLSYIPPFKLKTTMDKIFQALRPGGQFLGTLFFKPKKADHSFIETMGKLGAHFYPTKDFAREIITRSGFQMVNETERLDGGFFSYSHCLEFLAVKPA